MFTPYRLKSPALRPEDSEDVRLGKLANYVDGPFSENSAKMNEGDFVILGYPDDRGVERNGGRTGASEGPDAIRSMLYKMTPSALSGKMPKMWDLGNLQCWSMDLGEAHEEARKIIARLREREVCVVSLGGGHDWAWADFADWNSGPLFHLDSHLDMRPIPSDVQRAGHSGTAFRRILEKAHSHINLNVLGLQTHCNAKSHLKFSESYQISAVFLEELPLNLEEQMQYLSDKFDLKGQNSKVAISIDMDVFGQDLSPGVSAPQPLGLDPRVVFRLLSRFKSRIRHLGIYETNPRFDRDNQSARLAAKLVHHVLSAS
jgi:formiminoglutamase